MINKYLLDILRTFKRLFIDIGIKILNRMRFSINSLNGSSREISLLYEYSEYNLPNQNFCNLISEIYKQYNKFVSILTLYPNTLFLTRTHLLYSLT